MDFGWMGTIFNKQTLLLAYANDIDIVGRSLEAVRRTTNKRIAAGNRTILDAGHTMAFGDKNFEVVNEIVYLGAVVTPKNDVGLEIQRRVQTANKCFCRLRKHLRSSHLARQTKLTIYKTLIRLVLLYDSKTWVLTKREENRLLVFESKVLRTIYLWPKNSRRCVLEQVHFRTR
jgi:hypothetical protein